MTHGERWYVGAGILLVTAFYLALLTSVVRAWREAIWIVAGR